VALLVTRRPERCYKFIAQTLARAAHEHASETETLLADAAAGRLHPRDLKARIARELAARYHGAAEARAAEERFNLIFRQRETPEEIASVELPGDPAGVPVTRILASRGVDMAKSNAEAKRLIQQGGVSVNGEKIETIDARLPPGEYLFKVGKRTFKRIKLT
ncbi:MAG: S4 domain-containing protein, partial [bacterium]|nr:S4 domain-containing protein [bacterium]